MKAFFMAILVAAWGLGASASAQEISAEARTHMDRGLAAVEAARTEDDFWNALKEFTEAARLAPGWPDAWFNIARLNEKVGELDMAVDAYRAYLMYAPDASDAAEVRQTIARLQSSVDKERRLTKVLEMLTSPRYGRKSVSMKERSFIRPFDRMEMRDGGMMAWNGYKEAWNPSFPPKAFAPAWVPVTVTGNTYEYRFTYYQCDMAGSRDANAPAYCPIDVVVRGEIVSADPPQVREVETVSASWSSSPSPAGCPVGTSEYVWKLVSK